MEHYECAIMVRTIMKWAQLLVTEDIDVSFESSISNNWTQKKRRKNVYTTQIELQLKFATQIGSFGQSEFTTTTRAPRGMDDGWTGNIFSVGLQLTLADHTG